MGRVGGGGGGVFFGRRVFAVDDAELGGDGVVALALGVQHVVPALVDERADEQPADDEIVEESESAEVEPEVAGEEQIDEGEHRQRLQVQGNRPMRHQVDYREEPPQEQEHRQAKPSCHEYTPPGALPTLTPALSRASEGEKNAPVIYVLHGEDSFSATEALRELLDAVGPEDVRDSNVSEIEAREFSVDKLAAAAMVVPFLADRRAVVVRGLMGTAEGGQRRGRRGQDGAQARPPAELSTLLGELPPTSDVVFLEGKLSPANPFLKAVAEAGDGQVRVREFAPLRRDALAGWVSERAAQKGGAIDGRTASMLAEQIGPNLWVMDSELEKLTIYCDGRPIGEDDVKALVSSTKDANVFALVDAIMDGRSGVALSAMRQLLDEGAAGPYLLTMVARQARLVALAQELLARRAPPQEWPARLGTSSDFVVRKTMEQARRFPPHAVRALYRLLLDTDLALKSGTSDELALTEMLAQASALRAAR